ncbi:unnamed protein product [Medioppia subpectinata]|uniref:Phosphatidate cytidylyltransferase n=1 Tax=Medioppia subpectinata TaxID=1979941 RepID=A0A7R9PY72_9ACAR|nr:unnamed protein product [Medioppia subpectinata]CAG2105584.1 unnamed protein product [Medioppia subpectinata]
MSPLSPRVMSDPTLRQRNPGIAQQFNSGAKDGDQRPTHAPLRRMSSEGIDSEDDKLIDETNIGEMTKKLPQSTDQISVVLDFLPAKWRNYVVRSIFTCLMVSGFCLIIYLGPLALMFTFAWTHVTLLIVVTQSYLILQNMFEGLIWFIVPVSMIVINDVMAYLCGFFFGRTPLIKLSPKKTWEGFIGGGVLTVILGMIFSHVLCQYKYFVCPIEYSEDLERTTMDCIPTSLFMLTEYHLPSELIYINKLLPIKIPLTVTMYPFVLHSLSLSLFSSIIAPFGGFFASGFKRAFKIKDFGDIIPGHGGIVDRFDCQYLMATFVNVYISSFIRAPNATKLFQLILRLKTDEQFKLYQLLSDHLNSTNFLNSF